MAANLVKVGERTVALLPDNAQWTNRFEIPSSSSDRVYTVAQRKSNGTWACSCPGWIRWRRCKHLVTLQNVIAQLKGLPSSVEPRDA